MAILVTGGAGYIGSHTVLQLLEQGEDVVVLDNFCNSKPESLSRVAELTGKEPTVIHGDVKDPSILRDIFSKHTIDAVIHFAGLKAVGESNEMPVAYYHNNVTGTLILVEEMKRAGVHNLVFSSTATVYGDPEVLPITEEAPVGATTNPYGTSKFMVECVLQDLAKAEPEFSIAILRYFNPVGAHPSGRIGEDPLGIPNNLMPFISQVAVGKREKLMVFGDDYDTPDGTGVRDYIHVVDLAAGHLKALTKLEQGAGVKVYNLGTGNGYSVLEVVNAFKRVTGMDVPYEITDRRTGDIATCYANPALAQQDLGWQTNYELDDMLAHAWNWQKNNPEGF